jgi:hypothetical protein
MDGLAKPGIDEQVAPCGCLTNVPAIEKSRRSNAEPLR